MQTQHTFEKTDRRRRRPTSHSGPGAATLLWLTPLLLLGPGCGQADAPPDLSTTSAQPLDPTTAGGAEMASPETVKTLETWDAVYMGGAKIGFSRTLFETVAQDGQTWTKVSNWTELEIVRFGQRSTLSTHVESWERETGEVHSFKTETRAGPSPIIIEGRRHGEELDLVISTQGKQLTSTIPWDRSKGGFFSVEQSLTRQPMKPGERREVTLLMPGLTGIERVTSSLTAEVVEPVTLLDQTEQLLKITQSSKIGEMTIDSVGWTDAQGEILKTTIPSLNQTMIRTTKEIAQAAGSTAKYDLGWDSIVKITPPLPHPHQLTKTVYEVTLTNKNPAQVFVSCGSQMVESVDQHTARITILAVTPLSPTTSVPEALPGPGDTEPNNLIQADDPQIKKLAEMVAGQRSGTWEKCVELEKWVHTAIRAKNFGQGFATAADVARSLEGDCTEHAVLLAALCRAQSIPARVAVGLVYSPRDQGFAFHMWNEAWVDGRWIPLDATLGQGGIGAAHLKIDHSNLQGQGAETAVLGVVQVINQLKMRVLEYEPR